MLYLRHGINQNFDYLLQYLSNSKWRTTIYNKINPHQNSSTFPNHIMQTTIHFMPPLLRRFVVTLSKVSFSLSMTVETWHSWGWYINMTTIVAIHNLILPCHLISHIVKLVSDPSEQNTFVKTFRSHLITMSIYKTANCPINWMYKYKTKTVICRFTSSGWATIIKLTWNILELQLEEGCCSQNPQNL